MGEKGLGTMRRTYVHTGGSTSNNPTSVVRVEELFGLKAEREAASLSLDETALIERFLSGDETAFDQIVERFQDLVFNLSLRLLGGRDEAHDLSQEVFLQVYKKLVTFRREASLRTWIYRIVLNRAKNQQRWWRRREGEMTAVTVEDAERQGFMELSTSVGVSAALLPDRALERKELGRILQEAIATLPFEQRTVLLLKEIEGFSYEEISRTLNLAIGTVKSRLARARATLRGRLDPEVRELSKE